MLQTNESQLQDTRRSCDNLSLKLLDYGPLAFTFTLSCFHNMKAKLLAIYFETCPVARCGCGHLIGVFSRDNGEVRVNKLQQRQIKNIWLINSSVQCGGGARPGSPACPHMPHRWQHWLLFMISIKISNWAECVSICPLSPRTMDTIHHPPGEKRNVVKFFAVKINVSAWQYICQPRHNFGSNWRKVPKLSGNFFNFPLG